MDIDPGHVDEVLATTGAARAAPDGPPLRMRHSACGRVVKAVAVCSHCGETLSLRSVTVEPGPRAVDADFERTQLEGFTR